MMSFTGVEETQQTFRYELDFVDFKSDSDHYFIKHNKISLRNAEQR